MKSKTWVALGIAALAAGACSRTPAPEAPAQAGASPEAAPPAASTADTSAARASSAAVRRGCAQNFTAFDSNADQRLSLEEFLARPHANPDPEAVFRSRDGDGEGALTEVEFCSGAGPGAMSEACAGPGAGGCPGMMGGGHGPGMGMGPGSGHGPGMGMGPGMGAGHGGGPRCEGNFARFDANGDGNVSEQEFQAQPHAQADPHGVFIARDGNKDGLLSQAEFCAPWSRAGQTSATVAP